MKRGRDIDRSKGHLVLGFEIKRPRPQEMAAILRIGNHIFALFSKAILVIPTKLSRNIAGVRGTLSANLT